MRFGLSLFTHFRLSEQLGKQQQNIRIMSSSMANNERHFIKNVQENSYRLQELLSAPSSPHHNKRGSKREREPCKWENNREQKKYLKRGPTYSDRHYSVNDRDWRNDRYDESDRNEAPRAEHYSFPSSSKYPSQTHQRKEEEACYHSSRSRRREPSMDRYSPSQGYVRRAYRPVVELSDAEDDSRRSPSYSRQYSTHSPAKYRGSSKERYSFKERGSSRERDYYREKGTKATSLRSKPRKSYNESTQEAPRNYPVNGRPPKPLPLLVLDLNGTLVYRIGGNNSDRSKRPVLRPYLKSFLRYCLDVHESTGDAEDHRHNWDVLEASKNSNGLTRDANKGSAHGSHFWNNCNAEPEAMDQATYRLLLWSSAQPHNVDSMARAILTPNQAEQLLRVYARDTLVTNQLYSQKAPSIKDLEILWAILNSDKIGKEAEARLFAETRDRLDRGKDDNNWRRSERQGSVDVSEQAAKIAQDNVVFPKRNQEGLFEDGSGYGQHNTLLLDDSVDKAKLQPFNHVLLPEFDQSRAEAVLDLINRLDSSPENDKNKNKSNEKMGKVDNVLLQFIGVLEHARYQVNVSSWIRFGGLGNFGGVGKQHPYYQDDDDGGTSDKDIKEALIYFSKSTSPSEENLEPRLNTPIDERTEKFWIQEGKRALKRHDIPLIQI